MTRRQGTPIRAFAIFLLAGIIGIGGGVLGAGFQLFLDWMQATVIGVGRGALLADAVRKLSTLWTVLIPTLGGLAAGLLLYLVRRKVAPFGITDIIGLVQLRKGTIRADDSAVQTLSSACTIGSGGSIGREGATVQIAATVAALLGDLFQTNSRSRAVLLGCGVAAGFACAYNAPIASSIFVMEAVLGNFAMDVFAPIVVSSVIATMVRRVLLTNDPVYPLMAIDALAPDLVFAALLLGVVCGGGSVLFRRALDLGKEAFRRLRLPRPLAMALGGLCVGIIGLWAPDTWGNGQQVIYSIATTSPTVTLVLSLFVWKVIATSCTVGSGGLGGVFTPNLFVGAAFGAFFAYALSWISPGLSAAQMDQERITFTFVGMAGLCAAMSHAPVTSVVLVFELTRHYELVLPVMLCSIVASVVASMIDKDSYYTEALRKGGELPTGLEELAIKTTFVRDVMRQDVVTVRDTGTFDEVMDLLANHRGDAIYVLGADDTLQGCIQLQDVKNLINDSSLSSVVIAADLSRPAVSVVPEDSLATAMATLQGQQELVELAVTPPAGEKRRLLGRVTRHDVLASIGDEVLGQQRRARFAGPDRRRETLALPPGFELARVPVPDAWAGLAIDAIPVAELTGVAIVFVVLRDGEGGEAMFPASPERVLQQDQELVVIADAAGLERLGGKQ
jgi:CIC family chloride channel protein